MPSSAFPTSQLPPRRRRSDEGDGGRARTVAAWAYPAGFSRV